LFLVCFLSLKFEVLLTVRAASEDRGNIVCVLFPSAVRVGFSAGAAGIWCRMGEFGSNSAMKLFLFPCL